MSWIKELSKMYRIRSNIQLAADCAPGNEVVASVQRVTLAKMWNTNQIWQQIPEGVIQVDFDNGIVLCRPRQETSEDGAVWRLADLNVHFTRAYKNKIAHVEWDPVTCRGRGNR